MIVSIGVFYLKKRNVLPEFLKLSKEIYQQALESKGNISSKLDNEDIVCFYSFTHWETQKDMLHFVHSKKHGEVLKKTPKLCKKAVFLQYETETTVAITTAKLELKNHPDARVFVYPEV